MSYTVRTRQGFIENQADICKEFILENGIKADMYWCSGNSWIFVIHFKIIEDRNLFLLKFSNWFDAV